MTLAILCSGQGQQHAAMFDLTGTSPEAAPLFARATQLLGADPHALAGDVAARTANRAGQILCTLQALAAFEMLKPWPARLVVAGYSIGELAAWSLAGLLSPLDTLDLAARRADLMDASSRPGDGLVFVRGLPRDVVDALCVDHDAAIAIVNPDLAFVLGGAGSGLDGLARDAGRRGATRVQRLAVHVASHTPRLAKAAIAFGVDLGKHEAMRRSTGIRLLSGIDGAMVTDPAATRRNLAAQISSPVQWATCLEACVEAGATAFLELGPGHALSDMTGSAHPGYPSRSLDQFRSRQGVRAWIGTVG